MSVSADYNPCTGADGNAAKIWELLRRNHAFYESAERLLRNYEQSQSLEKLSIEFSQIDDTNPLAGFALRWLFKPALVTFSHPRPRAEFLKDWTRREREECGYPFLEMDEEWLHILEGLIIEEENDLSYPGPLARSEEPFSLNTAWPDTPDLFQFLFEWICQELAIGFPGWQEDAWTTVGKVDNKIVDWSFLDRFLEGKPNIDPLPLWELRRLRDLLERHDLFAVPRVIVHNVHKKELKDQFNSHLEELSEQGMFVDVRKYPHFLGTEEEWGTFAAIHSSIHEKGMAIGAAVDHFIKNKVKKGKSGATSSHTTHVTRRYRKMAALLDAVFPRLNFVALAAVGLDVPQNPMVEHSSQYAANAAYAKVQALHSFPKGAGTSHGSSPGC